jgi:type III pantothenate kinase
VITGICHEIEGYIRAAREKFGEVFVFLTGGDGISLKNNIKSSIFADKFLVAKGLNRILLKYDNI